MKVKVRHRLIAFGAIFLVYAFGAVVSFAQETESLISEGKSFEQISIGKSTMDDVVALYGQNYELMNHEDYSYEMIYISRGLSFYSCQSDPNKEIFDVEIRMPYKAKTNKGIVLGESTLGDVLRIYKGDGERVFSDSDQKGVLFFLEDDNDPDSAYAPEAYPKDPTELMLHKEKVIKRIKLIENGGLRQCNSKFPKTELK